MERKEEQEKSQRKIVVIDYRTMRKRMESENAALKAEVEMQKQEAENAKALLAIKQQKLGAVILKSLEVACESVNIDGLKLLIETDCSLTVKDKLGDQPVAELLKKLALHLKVNEFKQVIEWLGEDAKSVCSKINFDIIKEELDPVDLTLPSSINMSAQYKWYQKIQDIPGMLEAYNTVYPGKFTSHYRRAESEARMWWPNLYGVLRQSSRIEKFHEEYKKLLQKLFDYIDYELLADEYLSKITTFKGY